MPNEDRGQNVGRRHWIRWCLTLATVAAAAWLAYAMATRTPGDYDKAVQTAFLLVAALGIGSAVSWTQSRGQRPD